MTAALTEPTDRRLATVETVTDIREIPDADQIVCARIRGWDVVVKRGEFTVGDRCLYVEVDSLLDVTDPRFAFLATRGVHTDADGRTGHVLKTARLRGQYSQGLALPLTEFPELPADAAPGTDVTDTLGIVKWDPPIPAELAGTARGMRPAWIPSTAVERLQNNPGVLEATNVAWIATEKVDGNSTTVYVDPETGIDGVCSRNVDLIDAPGNKFWEVAHAAGVHARLAESFPGQRAAVQGETYGEGVRGNPLKIAGQAFAAFALYVNGREIPRLYWPQWLTQLSVPVYGLPFPATLEEALAQVETLKSNIAPERAAEGVVWRAVDMPNVALPSGQIVRAAVKVISNRYLLKHDR